MAYTKPTDEELKRMSARGLPDITHPAVTGATYPWTAPVLTEQEKTAQENKRVVGLAGIKPVGLIEPNSTATEPISTTQPNAAINTKSLSVNEVPEQKGFNEEGFKPYGYPEGDKVYTNRDIQGYATGLPEANQDITSYYRGVMENLNDRASHLADTIEAGFVKGRRLTAAVAELQSIHQRISGIESTYGETLSIPSKNTLAEAQAQEAIGVAGKARRETDIMATTNKQAYEQATGLADIKARQDKSEQMKAKRQEQVDKAIIDITKDSITYPDEKSKQDAINAVYAQFPDLNPTGSTGGNIQRSKSKSGKNIINRGNGWEYE